jgi:hypothetical protein
LLLFGFWAQDRLAIYHFQDIIRDLNANLVCPSCGGGQMLRIDSVIDYLMVS